MHLDAARLPRFGKKEAILPNVGKFRGGPDSDFAKAWQKRGIFANAWQIGRPGKNRRGRGFPARRGRGLTREGRGDRVRRLFSNPRTRSTQWARLSLRLKTNTASSAWST
jgi:hypothetical protein